MKEKVEKVLKIFTFTIISGILIILLWLGISQGISNHRKMMNALDAIELYFEPGDSEDSVTRDFGVPFETQGYEIEWVAKDESVLTIDDDRGVIVRGDEDVLTYLNAKFKSGAFLNIVLSNYLLKRK